MVDTLPGHMPWKKISPVEQRLDMVRRMAGRKVSLKQLCQHFGISRQTAYNGTSFGGAGPTGLTRLSAWWVKLGIAVEFIPPGRPCENGAHEQFHRIYKAEVAVQPEPTRQKQQQHSARWLRHYNRQRPHEGLGMKTPAAVFTRNDRRLKRVGPWKYPQGWERRWVKGNGEINRAGVRRYVGEAFVGDYVGLKPVQAGIWEVYFGPELVGELHEKESGSIRMAKYARSR